LDDDEQSGAQDAALSPSVVAVLGRDCGRYRVCLMADSDSPRAAFDQELAPADVVPMHRMQGVRPNGVSGGRRQRASQGRTQRPIATDDVAAR
jgi:hypothetical protein